MKKSNDYQQILVEIPVDELDPLVNRLIRAESDRQARKLVLIPSESMAPYSVRQALGSIFNNVYAEGYPREEMTLSSEQELEDFADRLTHYRRYANRRFYKGTEYVDLVESLAQERARKCFATDEVRSDEIFVNVQPLSGTAANLAIYDTFVDPGDTVMGMALDQGGHLSHGSQFNLTGKRYDIVSYSTSKDTGRLDYSQIREKAHQHQPEMIIAGYTSYSWAPDWKKFRSIADEVGATLLADISHTAGMAIAGAYPNPIKHAHVVMTTTHKTIFGPRGAIIMTTDKSTGDRIDQAIFPGSQGGPHPNKFAAMAVAFKIAQTEAFQQLQHRIVDNARQLADSLQSNGLSLAYGGTDTHLMVIDLTKINNNTGFTMMGEVASRILDLTRIVTNKNTIPGDASAAEAHGLRIGTPWITQRGMEQEEMEEIAEVLSSVLKGIRPFSYIGLTGPMSRGKIDHDLLRNSRSQIAELVGNFIPSTDTTPGFPQFHSTQDQANKSSVTDDSNSEQGVVRIRGHRPRPFLNQVCTVDITSIKPGESSTSAVLDKNGDLLAVINIYNPNDADGYYVITREGQKQEIIDWFRGLADGYLVFDKEDLFRKVEGPVIVEDCSDKDRVTEGLSFSNPADDFSEPNTSGTRLFHNHPELFDLYKPYFVGQIELESDLEKSRLPSESVRKFEGDKTKSADLRKTPLFNLHKDNDARMAKFVGWNMPFWYETVRQEHQAVRETAGLFDVGHMGVFEISGPHATHFLDTVTSNYVRWLEDKESQYTYLLSPEGKVIDDGMVYRLHNQRYIMVVNAVNEEKDWQWLQAVNSGEVTLDLDRPWVKLPHQAQLTNLKGEHAGERARIDLALQGPNSRRILNELINSPPQAHRLTRMKRNELDSFNLAGVDVIVARTGYTGEEIGYELLVHPMDAPTLWTLLMDVGEEYGIKPAGLGARDSTRIEAGLPLYGHELAGDHDISPTEAGFGAYVKFHKPFFIGRDRYVERYPHKDASDNEIVRFEVTDQSARMVREGTPLLDQSGQVMGQVTSCTQVGNRQVGMAYVQNGTNSEEGTKIKVVPSLAGKEELHSELSSGGKIPLAYDSLILPRFPETEEGVPGMRAGE